MACDNYGFKHLEVLTGNVGFLDVRYFAPVSLASETVVAANKTDWINLLPWANQ